MKLNNQKYWAVVHPKGWVWPGSITFYRSLAIKHFLNPNRSGWLGGNWRKARQSGFECRRIKIKLVD